MTNYINAIKNSSAILFLAILIFNVACGSGTGGCKTCGFVPGEIVYDQATGKRYLVPTTGCVTVDTSDDCSKHKIRTLLGQ